MCLHVADCCAARRARVSLCTPSLRPGSLCSAECRLLAASSLAPRAPRRRASWPPLLCATPPCRRCRSPLLLRRVRRRLQCQWRWRPQRSCRARQRDYSPRCPHTCSGTQQPLHPPPPPLQHRHRPEPPLRDPPQPHRSQRPYDPPLQSLPLPLPLPLLPPRTTPSITRCRATKAAASLPHPPPSLQAAATAATHSRRPLPTRRALPPPRCSPPQAPNCCRP